MARSPFGTPGSYDPGPSSGGGGGGDGDDSDGDDGGSSSPRSITRDRGGAGAGGGGEPTVDVGGGDGGGGDDGGGGGSVGPSRQTRSTRTDGDAGSSVTVGPDDDGDGGGSGGSSSGSVTRDRGGAGAGGGGEPTVDIDDSDADANGGRDPSDPRDAPSATPDPTTAPDQGVESGTGSQSDRVVDAATGLEQEVLDRFSTLDGSDVRVSRSGDRLEAELTRTGEEQLTADARQGGDARLLAEARRIEQQRAISAAQSGGDRRLRTEATPNVEGGDVRLAIAEREAREEAAGEVRGELSPTQNPFGGTTTGTARRVAEEVRDRDVIAAVLDATPIDEVARQDVPGRVRDLTSRGGLLSESQEADFRREGADFRRSYRERVIDPTVDAVGSVGPQKGSTARRRSTRAVLGAVGTIANVPANVARVETAAEVVANADPSDADEVAEAAAVIGSQAAVATGRTAVEKPAALAGETLLGLGGGAVAGRAAGSLGRRAIDRKRTVGAQEVDAEDLTSPDVLEGEEQFPGAADEDLYRSDPAEAVRQQANDKTPDTVAERLDEAGVAGDADLKKALDQPIDDPEGGNAFGVPDDVADEYEAPGSFVGPELSPNFLRVGGGRSSGLSLRPGLPDLGNRPTGAVIRTDVENPDANTLEGFADELRDREGDATAITKPADEVNPGEVEAVVPPGARFPEVDGGSADFYTVVEGRRVPIRTFGDDSDASNATSGSDPGRGPDMDVRDGDGPTRVDDVTERVDPRPDDRGPPIAGVSDPSRAATDRSSAPESTPASGGTSAGGPSSGAGSVGGGSDGGPGSSGPFSGSGFGSAGSGGGSDGDSGAPGGPGSPGSSGSPGSPGSPGGPGETSNSSPPRRFDIDPDEDDEKLFGELLESADQVFDTGVVQSIEELARRRG